MKISDNKPFHWTIQGVHERIIFARLNNIKKYFGYLLNRDFGESLTIILNGQLITKIEEIPAVKSSNLIVLNILLSYNHRITNYYGQIDDKRNAT